MSEMPVELRLILMPAEVEILLAALADAEAAARRDGDRRAMDETYRVSRFIVEARDEAMGSNPRRG
ncbi:MAG: hypothetical protein HQL41_14465 [Alphaproteobacteria bacterium]|nr:hypothetical protein [Alphaproteobacteria bacterium]